jgi:hypothetical protein
VGLACTKYGPVLGWVCARCVCFVACRDVQRSSSTAAVRRARTGTAASTVVAKPHSPPESCGATRKRPGLCGSASLAHVGTRVPFSPHRLDRETATATATATAGWSPHLHGCTSSRHPRLQQLQKAQRKAGAWVEVAGKSAADAACHPLHAGRFGAGDAPRCTPYPRPTASVLVKDPRRSAGASAISPALETDRRKRLGSRR